MNWLRQRWAGIRYRVGGLPLSFGYLRHPEVQSPANILRHAEARRYWCILSGNEVLELIVALGLLPVFVIGAAIWHTTRNAAVFARRCGRSPLLQFADQLRIYVASGVMPATYYIFSLPDQPTVARARSFLKRAETKGMIYKIVREQMPPVSDLNDKAAFEKRCSESGLPIIPTIAIASDGRLIGASALPAQDLFIKPLAGKGGRGAERWVCIRGGRFRSASGAELSAAQLIEHVVQRSRTAALIIQSRVRNHESLSALNCGALATFRILTCLDAEGEPEIVGAALRMAVKSTSVVDNLHQGGITAAVDHETGELGPATNLGKDASVGWLDYHPVTGAPIAGYRIADWDSIKQLALQAHRAFTDRLLVGWDIALTEEGPVIVEGNSSPDLDILQRSTRRGMVDSRFAELLAGRLTQWRICDRCAA